MSKLNPTETLNGMKEALNKIQKEIKYNVVANDEYTILIDKTSSEFIETTDFLSKDAINALHNYLALQNKNFVLHTYDEATLIYDEDCRIKEVANLCVYQSYDKDFIKFIKENIKYQKKVSEYGEYSHIKKK